MRKIVDRKTLEKKLLLKSETLRHLDLSAVTGGEKDEPENVNATCPYNSCEYITCGCTVTYG